MDSSHLHAAHDLAVRLAREAGALQVREQAGVTAHSVKAHANGLVSHVDLAREELSVGGLSGADLAYLACGRLDCAVLAGTKLWDVAAAPGIWEAFSTSDAAEQAVCEADTRPGMPAAVREAAARIKAASRDR